MPIQIPSAPRFPTGRFKRLLAGLVIGLVTVHPAALARNLGSPGTTITVNTTADGYILTLPGQQPPCTLRDAILAANTDQAVGGCPAGAKTRLVSANPLRVDNIDRIEFDIGAGTPTIRLRWGLPTITDAVNIDGATGGATRVVLDGGAILSFLNTPVHGLVVTGSFTSIENLIIHRFSGNGILLTVQNEDGGVLPPREPPQIDEEPPDLSDPSLDPCGPYSNPADPGDCPPSGGGAPNLPPISNGGGSHAIAGCFIGTDATGTVPLGNGRGGRDQAGIAVLTSGNQIGGPTSWERNVIAGNNGHGILLSGVNNVIENNAIGTDASGRMDLRNLHEGIRVDGGQFSTATCHIRGNTIAFNNGAGVSGGYNACGILANSIRTHGGLGIDMAAAGVTANDPTGARRQPPNTPVLTGARTTVRRHNGFPTFVTEITGTLVHRQSEPVHVEIYHSSACSLSGYGEGERLVGSTTVPGGGTRTFTVYGPPLVSGGAFTATATVENVTGTMMTSEFSPCFQN